MMPDRTENVLVSVGTMIYFYGGKQRVDELPLEVKEMLDGALDSTVLEFSYCGQPVLVKFDGFSAAVPIFASPNGTSPEVVVVDEAGLFSKHLNTGEIE